MAIFRTLGVRLEIPLFLGATKVVRNPPNYTQMSLSSPQVNKTPLWVKKKKKLKAFTSFSS